MQLSKLHKRVDGREQLCSRCASHTTVRTDRVYGGSLFIIPTALFTG